MAEIGKQLAGLCIPKKLICPIIDHKLNISITKEIIQ